MSTDRQEVSFYFLPREAVLDPAITLGRPGLPRMQEIRDRLVRRSYSLSDAVYGTFRNSVAAVSHRWETPEDPDPTGEQLRQIRSLLEANDQVKFVWIDFACMPQGKDRTQEDQAEFNLMLHSVNRLYLGGMVFILLDNAYMSRFWTQFEAWLSLMAFSEKDGLVPCLKRLRRCRIATMYSANSLTKEALVETWARTNPETAKRVLQQRDIVVTNQSDKEVQLKKVDSLCAEVKLYADVKVQIGALGDPATRSPAMLALRNLSVTSENQELIIAHDGIRAVVGVLTDEEDDTDGVRENAASVLAHLAVHAGSQVQIAACGGIPPLLDIARGGLQASNTKQSAAAEAILALLRLAATPQNRARITGEAGLIEHLVSLLHEGIEVRLRATAAQFLGVLAEEEGADLEKIVQAGGIELLVVLASEGPSEDAKEQAGYALWKLTRSEENQQRARDAGAVPAMSRVLEHGISRAQEYAAAALSNLLLADSAAAAAADVIPTLATLLREGRPGAKEQAMAALRTMSMHSPHRVAIACEDVLDSLVALLGQGSLGQPMFDTASHLLKSLTFNIVVAWDLGGASKLLSSTPDGQALYTEAEDDGSGRQQWVLESVGDGLYRIRVKAGTPKGRSLLVASKDSQCTKLMDATKGDGFKRQHWFLNNVGDSTYQIVVSGGTRGNKYLRLMQGSASLQGDSQFVGVFEQDDSSLRQVWHFKAAVA